MRRLLAQFFARSVFDQIESLHNEAFLWTQQQNFAKASECLREQTLIRNRVDAMLKSQCCGVEC